MTEQLFTNEVVNDLFAGSLPVAEVPATLDGVALVVHAARQAATENELQGIAALMQRFAAEVVADNASITPLPTTRSPHMIATRITRRAAAIVAVTLLAAGTAAAAAGGALPSAFSAQDAELVEDIPTTAEEPTTTAETTTTIGEDDGVVIEDDVDVAPVLPLDESTTTLHDPETADHFGKCTAWTNGTAKKITNPSFAELQVAADAGTVSVDEYCEATLAAKAAEKADRKADKESDGDEADDDDEADEADDDESDDDDDAEKVSKDKGKGSNGASRGKGHSKND